MSICNSDSGSSSSSNKVAGLLTSFLPRNNSEIQNNDDGRRDGGVKPEEIHIQQNDGNLVFRRRRRLQGSHLVPRSRARASARIQRPIWGANVQQLSFCC